MSRFHTDPWVGIVDPGDESVEVRKMNWRAFRTLILRENRTLSLDLMDKMCYLLSFCDVLNSKAHIYALWLELNRHDDILIQSNTSNTSTNRNINLKLIISLSHYMSNTTLESTLQKIESNSLHKIYFLIQIFEDGAFNRGPLLTLRCDRYGEYGELVWLQKGNKISGQTMLNFCNEFINYFAIKSCYLMDSAQINLINDTIHTPTSSNPIKKKAHLRLIHILSNYNALTWYESKGNFERIQIKKWPLIPTRNTRKKNKNIAVISQDITVYEKSISFVRNFKLTEIKKYLSDMNKIQLNTIIHYYKQYTFDYDTKMKILKQNQDKKYEARENRYCLRSSTNRSRARSRSRSRSRNRNNNDNNNAYNSTSRLSLITVHDLCRRVHVCAFYGPTKWRKVLGQRHLRILYDIIIDPGIALKLQNNPFSLYEKGRRYLQCLNEITNFRVFCKGKHCSDRINGIIVAKHITKHEINKFNKDFENNISVYKDEREERRQKYSDGIEITLSLNIKNANVGYNYGRDGRSRGRRRKYKHEISIDSNIINTNNDNHEIEITVKSKSKTKRRNLKQTKRSHSLSKLKRMKRIIDYDYDYEDEDDYDEDEDMY